MNVGIVGCGRVTGLRHLPALRSIEDARVVALADVDAARLEQLADEYGVERRYGSHVELVEDEGVEAVAVCVPAAAHAEVALAALEAGKHLLIEKPLCLDLDDAERVRKAAEGAVVTAMVGFNLRWHRLVRRARELVFSGTLGEVESIRTVFTSSFDYRGVAHPWRFRRELGGGALMEMAPHHFDMWRYVSGREVEEVFASSRSSADDDETAVVSAALDGGARATALVSQRSTNVNELEVFGTHGRLRLDCYRCDGVELRLGRGFSGDLRQRLRELARAVTKLPLLVGDARRGGAFVESYAAEWRHFLEQAAAGQPAEPGLEDGVRNLEIVLAAVESAGSGRPVRIAAREVAAT